MQPKPNHSPRPLLSVMHLLPMRLAAWGLLLFLLSAGNLFAGGVPGTNLISLAELQDRVAASKRTITSFRVEGVVCVARNERGLVALQDDSATVLLELPLASQNFRPGMWLAVEGNDCALTRSLFGIQIGTAPVAEMDGLHPARGDSGSVFLAAGRQPLRVEWFNGVRGAELRLEYEGPGVPRQRIPDRALTHRVARNSEFEPGLEFAAYTGDDWTALPNFRELQPVATGVVTNLDVERRTRAVGAGLVFTGFLQISNAGFYTFHLLSDDGGRIYTGDPAAGVKVTVLDRPARLSAARSLAQVLAGRNDHQWAVVEGRIGFANHQGERLEFEITAQGRPVSVMIVDGAALAHTNVANQQIRVTGICQFREEEQERTPRLIVASAEQVEFIGAASSWNTNEVLTTAAQVRSLQPEEARRPLRVRVRGVVTYATHWSCVLQDATGGVFTWFTAGQWAKQPRPEELWEFEGVTDPGDFSPLLTATNATFLGNTVLPEPIVPTWEQLMNGSLDAEQVEIQGVILEVSAEEMTLLTRDGKITIVAKEFYPLPTAPVENSPVRPLRGSVVRVRGVLAAEWDRETLRVKPGRFYLGNAVLSLDEPAAGDSFSATTKHAADLLLFTSHIGALSRVKVSGLVLHAESREYVLSDGGVGFRVLVNEPQPFQEGDVVEAVGFPQLGGPSPALLEAKARKIGNQPRPAPRSLSATDLSDRKHDATLVQTEAMLLNDTVRGDERVLELQAGQNHFFARLHRDGPSDPALRRGSRLQLTGVYSSVRQDSAGNNLDAFELLLNRAADIVVLRQGPWWTVWHTIVTIAALLIGLAAALVWITQLRRTVARRTEQLRREIDERQQIERHRAVEQERARIAQDLHDDLGAGLAHIGLMGALAQRHSTAAQPAQQHLTEITDKSRKMVAALDEIVWATSPKHDSATSVSSYLCTYAEEFLRPTNVSCRFDVTSTPADYFSTSLHRHQLLLAFKEALSNVVKHAGASEVWIRIRVEGDHLCVVIEDNGKGIAPGNSGPHADGLRNMRDRLENIGGRCEIETLPAGGTAVRFHLPTSLKSVD